MPDKVLVVTFPDDVIIDAKRILLFDPTAEQTQLISSCLSANEFGCDIVFYIWRFGDDIDWLLDKILKYDLAICFFNIVRIMNSPTLIEYLWQRQQTRKPNFPQHKAVCS